MMVVTMTVIYVRFSALTWWTRTWRQGMLSVMTSSAEPHADLLQQQGFDRTEKDLAPQAYFNLESRI